MKRTTTRVPGARRADPLDPVADPFEERGGRPARRRIRMLGGDFLFESASRALLRLVDQAFAGLPAHRLGSRVPRFTLRLALTEAVNGACAAVPPRPRFLGGAGLVCASVDAASYAIVCPAARTALVAISRELLKSPYHARYELIEFAVLTLAARSLGLVPLHAACIGRGGRGLVLLGATGAGKSTATLQALLDGFELVAEDSLFVVPTGMRVTGLASFVHVRRDSLEFLSARDRSRVERIATPIRRRSGVEKLEIDVRRSTFQIAPTPVTLEALVFLSPRPARRGPLLVAVSARAALARLVASQPYAAGQPGWTAFTRRALASPAFELRRGAHPREGVAALATLLKHSRRRG